MMRRIAAVLLLAAVAASCSEQRPDAEDEQGVTAPAGAEAPSPSPDASAEPPGTALEAEPPAADDESEGGPGESPADDATGPRAMRGAWVHLFDDTLKTREGIAALVDELAAAGASAVIAQVARRHDAYYDSTVLPGTLDPALEPGLDILDELLRHAHARGIEVHAWISVAPTWHEAYTELDAPAGWLATTHGLQAPPDQRWVTRTAHGEWSDYLDPALPQVRARVVAVAVELAARYPIDGVHLDYVRYASAQHGYHPDALDRFHAETGAVGRPAPDDPEWSSWRRGQTREMIAATAAALDAADHDIALSAAVVTWGAGPGSADAPTFEDTRAFSEALQDWPGWVREGLLDAVMPMNYFRDHDDEQAAWFGQWTRFQAGLGESSATVVVAGVGGWLNAPDAVLAQVRAAADRSDGALVYSFQQPTDDGSRAVWEDLATEAWWLADDDG